MQVSNPRARLPFSRVERKEVEKGPARCTSSRRRPRRRRYSAVGGGSVLGFLIASQTGSHCRSGKYISVHYREVRLRRLRLVTSRYDLASRKLAAHARPPAFSGRNSQLRDLYRRLGVMCCAYSTSTSTPATQLHSQRNTMLINQHKHAVHSAIPRSPYAVRAVYENLPLVLLRRPLSHLRTRLGAAA